MRDGILFYAYYTRIIEVSNFFLNEFPIIWN